MQQLAGALGVVLIVLSSGLSRATMDWQIAPVAVTGEPAPYMFGGNLVSFAHPNVNSTGVIAFEALSSGGTVFNAILQDKTKVSSLSQETLKK